jgi:peptidoglycan/LPS O-acetylase OafA/YrhL
VPWYYLYASNWGFAFSRLSDTFGIGLTWSLAIEEQFYLVWPLIVYNLRSTKLAFLSILLIFSSLILRIGFFTLNIYPLDFAEFFYHATFTRFDSIILGALIAIAFESDFWKKVLKFISAPMLFITLGLIGYFIYLQPHSPLWDNPPMYIYGFTLIALGAGGLVVILTTFATSNPMRWLFRNRILCFFGKYSYAIYIFHRLHLPLLENIFKKYFINGLPAWLLFNLVAIIIPILMALISWNILEKPILNLKKHFEYQAVNGKASLIT